MAQGTRVRVMRLLAAGFGVLLCTGLVGCMNWNKPKEIRKQPDKGLPGTPRLDAAGNPIGKAGQPSYPYNGPGSNVQPTNGFSPAPGMGNGPSRFGTNGINTNTSGGNVQPIGYTNYPNGAGQPMNTDFIGMPVQPRQVPTTGPLGSAPPPPSTPPSNFPVAPPSGVAYAPSTDPIGPIPPPVAPGLNGEPIGVVQPPTPGVPPPIDPSFGFGKGG